ncbi:hypothetical protein FSP39_006146 [Pinctada imbricata]|uniref:Uncharacterized protein n=1 Tax=Pinctada imbricata TaxID=66713 RepID=A0AA88XQ96_PINIB|nr:hypothetical protein FSP39_006146 [Pinctada imbricata]
MQASSKFSVDGDTEDDDRSVVTSLSRNTTGPIMSRTTKKTRPWKLRAGSDNPSDTIREEALKTYEPTYRMEPYQTFSHSKTKKVIEETISTCLNGFKYPSEGNYAAASAMTKKIPEAIVQKVKALEFDRYKIVCFVTLGSMNNQSLSVASRCMWDNSLDTSVSYTYKKDNFYCSAVVFGLYKE